MPLYLAVIFKNFAYLIKFTNCYILGEHRFIFFTKLLYLAKHTNSYIWGDLQTVIF